MNRQNRGNRPNRNKKHPQNQPQKNGSSGAQVARKGSNQIDLEDLDYEEEFSEDEDYSEDDEWEISDTEVEGLQRDLKLPDKPPERRKVEMQILHMSDQSQQMIIQMLKEIHGSQYKMKDASTYTDAGQKIDRRFWIQDRLRVTNVIDFSKEPVEKSEEEKYDEFALKKLESYGFHNSRCIESLNKANGDVGQAFENLMVDLFELSLEPSIGNDLQEDQKEDEKLAIQSIYGDEALSEKIPGKLWELQLELPSLIDLMSESKPKNPKENSKMTFEMLQKDKNVCQFYLRGNCKFGKKCFKKHQKADSKEVIDDKHLSANDEDTKFIMEIRFRENFSYPENPPLVSLNTKYSKIPRQACLKVTARLMEEAKNLSLDQCPSVFSLINLLDDLTEMKMTLNRQDVSFSFAAGLEPTNAKTGTAQDRLMSSLGCFIIRKLTEQVIPNYM